MFYLVLTFICVPICYNAARERLEERSRFDLKCMNIANFNYGFAVFVGVVFFAIIVVLFGIIIFALLAVFLVH